MRDWKPSWILVGWIGWTMLLWALERFLLERSAMTVALPMLTSVSGHPVSAGLNLALTDIVLLLCAYSIPIVVTILWMTVRREP
jgi:hypothetical protein